ncbi:hypothetical protein [Collimonas pratensis]|uniref:Uncharacterized protein n=1 Tax=Collimonas pratensis TaxID=279113 RepID=A0ABN4M9D4_9BURK|nr:hypothetical protein [Collimonas pratensis]AMP14880.1 hypothetical protein CPter291_2623 [Collimonas pratensis]
MSAVSGNAAIEQALSLLKTDREAIRSAHWNTRSLAARRIAVMSASMPKERADEALKNFNALERGMICIKVRQLIKQLEEVAIAMQGGVMPDNTEGERFHQANGIADIGKVI